jgi:hypothetical protein
MNLQVHRVLSDITGFSGLRILDAILAGERDPIKLAQLCHSRVKSSQDTLVLRHYSPSDHVAFNLVSHRQSADDTCTGR